MNIIARYSLYIAIGYALLVVVVYVIQRNLIYFPDKEKPTAAGLATMDLQFWPQAAAYKGLISVNAPQPANGTVIVFHGNAGSAWHRNFFISALAPLGYRVILAEYPGYGGRSGKINEKNFVEDAKELTALAQADFEGPIYLLGESMGGGIAAAVAGDSSSSVAGLILITPWDSLADVAQTHYWYLPARWLVKDLYNSITNLASFDRPVAVAMALNDEVIPNKHTRHLFNTITAPKRLWEFPDAGHNDWPTQPHAQWWSEVMAFVNAGR